MVGKRFFSLVGAISNLRASFVWKHHHQPMFMHRNTHSSSETWQYLFQSQKEVGASCCWSLADVRLGLTMEAIIHCRSRQHVCPVSFPGWPPSVHACWQS